MRDRSGFDLDGNGQIDRDPIAFASGFYTAYTDEAHGYGNAGTDDPPAQSPLDSQPEPGSNTPDLSDAAWTATAGDSHFSDGGEGWTDNYADPSSGSGNWEFDYDCLSFDVLRMTGNGDGTVAGEGPAAADGDLTGDVRFTLGAGCGAFDYGYGEEPVPAPNTAPEAVASATPTSATVGTTVTLDASASTDAETPGDLTYSWDLGDGGGAKDAEGAVVEHAWTDPGTYDATVTVSDAAGLTDTATVRVTVVAAGPGGGTDPTPSPTPTPTPTPTDPTPGTGQPELATTSVPPAELTRRHPCQGRSVGHLGSWRVVQGRAPGGTYCDNGGTRRGRDVLRLGFRGDSVDLVFGRARRGGTAVLFVDGERVGRLSFSGRRNRPRLDRHAVISGLGDDRPHRLRLVVKRGRAFVEGFRTLGETRLSSGAAPRVRVTCGAAVVSAHRGRDQHASRLPGVVRHARVGRQGAVGQPAVEQQREGPGQAGRVVGTRLARQLGDPGTHRRLVLDRALVHGRAGHRLGGGVDEGAAAVAVAAARARERVEHPHQLVPRIVARRLRGRVQLPAPGRVDLVEVGQDQLVLGREVLVEGRLRHPRLGDDQVHPHGADPAGVEERERGLEDPVTSGDDGHGLMVDRSVC